MRFYLVASYSFPDQGYFHISQLTNVLTEKCGYSCNTRESKRRILKQLRIATTFFTETKEGYFTFNSYRRFLGYKRNKESFKTVDFSILHKDNNKDFTDLLIQANASGQRTATQNICNQTGYKRARTFSGLKGLKRYNITHAYGIYNTFAAAQKVERDLYFEQGLLTRIVKNSNSKFEVRIILGNSFVNISDSGSIKNGMREELAADIRSSLMNCSSILKIESSKGKKSKTVRETRVFSITDNNLTRYENAYTGETVYYLDAKFLNDKACQSFIERHRRCA